MQKHIIGGIAVLGVAGAGLFVAAQHALRHPDSLMGRCATMVYHLGDPWFSAGPDGKATRTTAEQGDPGDRVVLRPPVVFLEAIEPLVLEAADQEAALPRLSPEIAAAIERLRSEEENEAPLKSFDTFTLTARMPYADEEVEVLPFPQIVHVETEITLPGTYGFFIVPPWQAMLDRLMEAVRMSGN